MDPMNPTDEGDVDRIIDGERDEREVSLHGCDEGEPVIVSSRIAFFSPLIKDALQESDQDTMELARVPGRVLRKVVEFMEHYVMVEAMHEISDMVLATKTFEQSVHIQWYRDFITGMDQELLFAVLQGANYMMVSQLMDLICVFVTFQLTGKTEKEIRGVLIFPELQPETEEKARRELPWVFDEQ